MTAKTNPLTHVLKKDRLFVLAALFLICTLSWLYIIYLYNQMYPMNMDALFFAMPMTAQWTGTDFGLLFFMWVVMMIAMMTPSVAPLVLIFTRINRKRRQQKNPFVPSGYLLGGYFLVWAGFSLLATVMQWLLQRVSLLSPEMKSTNHVLGGIVLISAGVFQVTPLKTTCLRHCRSPIGFIHQHWKAGKGGALQLGIKNGVYCLGCCWILMLLLFVAGVMNLLWIAVIAVFVLLEKLAPGAKMISMAAGAVLIIGGMLVLLKWPF